ncbi:MAG: methyltransferase [Vicinamibacterales bacterium]
MTPEHSLQMMQMMTGGFVAQAVSTAAEFGIADHLVHGPRSTAQLAEAVHASPAHLHRLLRFLASLGVFEEGAHGWSLTPLGELLRSDVPGSVRAGARMMARCAPATIRLYDNVRTGTCAYPLAFGKPIFEDLAGKPDDAALFDIAMKSFHGGETDAVLNAYSYDDVSVLADIGCGSGEVMTATLQRYPALRAILFDQAHVMQRTEGNMQAAGLAGRCQVAAGNFFEAVPTGADAYAMRHILHDWQDDQCVTILRNIRRVIPASGRLLVIEAVVPDGNSPSPAKLFDMIMMTLPDGMERTEAQFRALFDASGFRLAEVTPTQSPVSVIEARPV